jgi:2-amino-4-hydroxy-6-hydroxymethyldihydropteridine diphosphokinase
MSKPLLNRHAFFSLGSNQGDRAGNLERASEILVRRTGILVSRSGMYVSPPWGYQGNGDYFNCCLAIQTGMDPLPLLKEALLVERELGRERGSVGSGDRKERYSDRIIDIDLLLLDALIMKHPDLTLPHPRMTERKFVLVPLEEIAPDLIHPVTGMPIRELLQACPDPSEVRIV